MKNLLYIIVAVICFGCKTKSLLVDKSFENKQISYSKKFDSLFQLYSKLQLELSKKQSSFSSSFILKSIPIYDSLGNRKPLNYKHYIDGVLAEEIYIDGGELTQTNAQEETQETKKKSEVNTQTKRIESDVGLKVNAKAAKKVKEKEVEVKGFQFGFYLWLFFLLVVLIILYWIASKFKLPDKFMSLFKSKGGKK